MFKVIAKTIWNGLALTCIVLSLALATGIFPKLASDSEAPTIATKAPILEAISHVNKQVFIEYYNAIDVSYEEVAQGLISVLGLKQEFIILIRGRVPAGFDLTELDENDIWVSTDGNQVQLTLPSPKIFEDNVSIDFKNSYIISQRDSCPSSICQDDLNVYQNEILPSGQQALIDFAHQNGILEQVARDGKEYYEQLLASLGYEDIRVIVTGY